MANLYTPNEDVILADMDDNLVAVHKNRTFAVEGDPIIEKYPDLWVPADHLATFNNPV